MSIILRNYQTAAVEAIEAGWATGIRRPAVVLPTGAGKTVVFAALIDRFLRGRGGRALVLAHRDELVSQAVSKIRSVAPHLRVGVVKAERDEVRAEVVVASVQTLRSAARRVRLRDVGLVVVDECHHAVAETYLAILRWYGALPERGEPEQGDMTRGAVAVGVTATMIRGDKLALGDVWQKVVYEKPIAAMIRDGYLTEPKGVRVKVSDLDLGKVRQSGGDYAEGALGDALEESMAPSAVARAWGRFAPGLPGFLFTPTVSAAYTFGEALNETGASTAVVHGELPVTERRAAVDQFNEGKLQVLSNCMVFTEGTDIPRATVAGIARPTRNPGLYLQMVGRVLRPYPGKERAVVLDVVGVAARHPLVSLVDLLGGKEDEVDEDGLDIDLKPEDEETEGAGLDEPVYVDGELVAEEVDLFAGSRLRWIRTALGVPFLSLKTRIIAVVPGPVAGTWDVVHMDKYRVGSSAWLARGVEDFGYAMGHAEDAVTFEERSIISREVKWRTRQPSERQQTYARRLGVAWDGIMNAGQLGDGMAYVEGTRRIDSLIPAYALGRIKQMGV